MTQFNVRRSREFLLMMQAGARVCDVFMFKHSTDAGFLVPHLFPFSQILGKAEIIGIQPTPSVHTVLKQNKIKLPMSHMLCAS